MKFSTKKLERYSAGDRPLLINLGCGPVQPPGWLNIDNSNRAHLARYLPPVDHLFTRLKLIPQTEYSTKTTLWDIRKKLPFRNNSVRAFYAGELWEHLLVEQAERLVRECFRALILGGHLRVNVPDNYAFWRRYCDAHEQMLENPRRFWDDRYSKDSVKEFFEWICTKRPFLGSMGHFHKWAYDEVSLIRQFELTGFNEVTRKSLHDSAIPDVEAVERVAMLVVEGTKPSDR